MNLKRNPISRSCKIRVGITIGDPSGIGPLITRKAIKILKGLAEFVVIGDPPLKASQMGKIRAEYGKSSIKYLDVALGLLKNKEIDCLVTCPISKQAVKLAGFDFIGHTEYLARRSGVKDFAMMLLNQELKICLATRHIPLSQVHLKLNKSDLEKTVSLTISSLQKLFRIKTPRLVVCGLNPHASDNGLIGSEENEIIEPALEKIRNKSGLKLKLEPADVAIYKAREKQYDAVIAIYHDQALIPLKLTDRFSGVNLTLGLPYVRTSPLHGTAFDIAAANSADPSSLIAAVKTAIECTLNLKKA